ncbi:alpha/beta fold hydrolase [Roseicitreum antarcticum]|uniref:Pimeloyl-ACP methyl ester carboxylesterase n=1 Tax=Roseicitreum antarcticum TaxID=564137 RepID=A0A1H3CFN8_9RHOB|nr:alpha/beta hydrolase [Roseicitreum antarcticum]SDX52925.1 Pimeloyl-ACP methyl ester carboxylesterase [Roseicitreum antarcticum]
MKRRTAGYGLAAAALFLAGCAAAVDNRATRRETAWEAMHPPSGQFIETAGRRVHATVSGSGPDLVLIHGASGNLRDFTFDLVGRLERDFRVIAFDRPGMGYSDDLGPATVSPVAQADALRDAARQLGVRQPIILGHSYGGAVALAWALRAPSEVSALVLLAAASYPWDGGLGALYSFTDTAIGRHTVAPMIAAFATQAQAESVARGIFAPQSAPPGYVEHVGVGLAMRRGQFNTNSEQVNGLKPYLERMAPEYPDLTLPIEMVHGDADTTVGLSIHSQRLAADVDSANLTVLDGIGHMPHHADPEAVVAAIRRAAARAR